MGCFNICFLHTRKAEHITPFKNFSSGCSLHSEQRSKFRIKCHPSSAGSQYCRCFYFTFVFTDQSYRSTLSSLVAYVCMSVCLCGYFLCPLDCPLILQGLPQNIFPLHIASLNSFKQGYYNLSLHLLIFPMTT